jgi:hypothetical protein
MRVVLSSTLSDSLARLTAAEQSAAKQAVFDYQVNPAHPGLRVHRIESSRDQSFASARVNADLRLVIHRTADTSVLCYVGHHDDAYRWAERRRLEVNPDTGAAQFVVIDERVENVVRRIVRTVVQEPPVLAAFGEAQLRTLGVPQELLPTVLAATRSDLPDLIGILPDEAMERIIELADGRPPTAPPERAADPFRHPDAARRFRIVDTAADVRAALDAGWARWSVYLHPDQRNVVDRRWSGPVRLSGAAGTGKTVVALHRAVHLLSRDPAARVLLTTFSRTLSARLAQHADLLLPELGAFRRRITIENIHVLARQLWCEFYGVAPRIADEHALASAVELAIERTGGNEFPASFVRSEWSAVVDPFAVRTLDAYLIAARGGRGTPLNPKQRRSLWPVLECIRATLSGSGLVTWAEVFNSVADLAPAHPSSRFDHVLVDEVQDLGIPELRLVRSLVAPGPDDILVTGDAAQRIFRGRSALASAGIDIRGRAPRLKVNYRTTKQIQVFSESALAGDGSNLTDEDRYTVCLLAGPEPELVAATDPDAEAVRIGKWLSELAQEGLGPRDIALFGRTEAVLERARRAVSEAGMHYADLRDDEPIDESRVSLGTMHRAKGLEFRAVALVGCEDGVLPLGAAVNAAGDAAERADATGREMRLFYVACTRARERLLISWSGNASPFFASRVPAS